jgi:hypothetical protein
VQERAKPVEVARGKTLGRKSAWARLRRGTVTNPFDQRAVQALNPIAQRRGDTETTGVPGERYARAMDIWNWPALGTPCANGRHRLRTRSGHCVQCDPKKLAFQARHSAEQYVYIAGSVSKKLIKIGTCKDVPQRERQIRAERYGGAGDWNVIFSVRVQDAGDVECRARSKLNGHAIVRPYWKDRIEQQGVELLRCSFSRAREALMDAAQHYKVRDPWQARLTYRYEFDEN